MKLAESILEAVMKSSTGKSFEIPSGKWIHLKRSPQWEKDNGNDAKGLTGDFRRSGIYLEWTSDDGKESMSIDVKDIQLGGKGLHLTAKSGLEYWFKKG